MNPSVMSSELGDLTFTTVFTSTAMTLTFSMEIDGDITPFKAFRLADAMETVAETYRREAEAKARR